MTQEALRTKLPHGPTLPTLPPEIINKILSHVPTKNRLVWDGAPKVYVAGLLPHAIYDPSLLPPHYHDHNTSIPRRKQTLKDIAKQKMSFSLLGEASLANQIELHVENCQDFSTLRPFLTYPLRWKKFEMEVCDPNENFAGLFQPCFSSLEELKIYRISTRMLHSIAFPRQKDTSSHLKAAYLSFRLFQRFFNTGLLNSITSLELGYIDERSFPDYDAFKGTVQNLPQMFSQLPYLYELNLTGPIDRRNPRFCDLVAGLPRVKSTSLHSLNVARSYGKETIGFLNLFSDCRIDYIAVEQHLLQDIEGIFSDVRHIRVRVSPKEPPLPVKTVESESKTNNLIRVVCLRYYSNEKRMENSRFLGWIR